MSKANPRFHRTNPPLPNLGPDNAFLATFGGFADFEEWFCNVMYMCNNVLSPTSELQLANTLETAVTASLRNVIDSTTTFTTIKVQCLNVPSRQPDTLNVNAGIGYAGLQGATHIPKEMAVVTSKYTQVKGQHGRGRNYWPAVPSAFVTPGVNANSITAAAVTAYYALLTALQANTIIADGVRAFLAVCTRLPKGAPVTQGATVGTVVVKPVLGTVRRRRPGRGK